MLLISGLRITDASRSIHPGDVRLTGPGCDKLIQNEHRKTVLPRITLDHNCLFEVSECRPYASDILKLVELHRSNVITLSVTGAGAAERPKNSNAVREFSAYQAFLASMNLSDINILKPVCVVGLTYTDWCMLGDDASDDLRCRIRDVLFARRPDYANDCARRGLDPNGEVGKKYRNEEMDVIHLWTHILHDGDAFVTRDRNFHKSTKKPRLEQLGAKRILQPGDAVKFAQHGSAPSRLTGA